MLNPHYSGVAGMAEPLDQSINQSNECSVENSARAARRFFLGFLKGGRRTRKFVLFQSKNSARAARRFFVLFFFCESGGGEEGGFFGPNEKLISVRST